jgi:hypothetical protein
MKWGAISAPGRSRFNSFGIERVRFAQAAIVHLKVFESSGEDDVTLATYETEYNL